MDTNLSRRSFFGKSVVAGSAATVIAGKVNAKPRKKISKVELMNIGVIALGDNSHMNYSIWAPMINPTEPDKWRFGRTTRMRITHAWDSRPENSENFCKKV